MSQNLKSIATRLGVYTVLKKGKIILYDLLDSEKIAKNRKKEIEFYSAIIKQGQLCFDVGANVGDKSEIFLKLGAKVVAIEPQKDCVNKLKKRLKHFGPVTVLESGLSHEPGIIKLSVSGKTNTISTMSDRWKNEGRFSKEYSDGHVVNVEVTTLDNLIEKYGCPDYIKIDVEGYELNVLKGLSKPVGLISFEFIEEFFDDALKCLDQLSALGKIKINVLLGIPEKFLFGDFLEPEEFLKQMRRLDMKGICGDIFVQTEL